MTAETELYDHLQGGAELSTLPFPRVICHTFRGYFKYIRYSSAIKGRTTYQGHGNQEQVTTPCRHHLRPRVLSAGLYEFLKRLIAEADDRVEISRK